MKKIELPIFHFNDHTSRLRDVGIDWSYEDCDIKMMTFYNIDVIGIDEYQGKDYGLIISGGSTFTSPLTYKQLKQKYEEEQS